MNLKSIARSIASLAVVRGVVDFFKSRNVEEGFEAEATTTQIAIHPGRHGVVVKDAGGGGGFRSFAMAAGLGAGLMYLLDSQSGARRRSLLRDQVIGLQADTRDTLEKAGRDLRNRSLGVGARVRSRVSRGTRDVVLERRSRADSA